MVLIGSDFSQLEVIVEANLTEDKQLLKIILEGASKHDITATGIGIHRDKAKTLNFACQYGAGTHKISKILDISYRDAEDIFNRYWLLYGGVKALKDQTAREVARKGFVTTLFGRSRHFDTPKNEFDKARIERMAYNHLIQGTGADITNRASYLISEKFKESQVGRFLFSVHDEVIAEVRKDDLEIGQKIIQDCMLEPSSYLKLKYPIQSKSYGPILCWSKT
jgi:DNA polymerase-1